MDTSEALQIILNKLDKLDNMEKNISDMESDISEMKSDISGMDKDQASILTKLDAIDEDYKATNATLAKLIDWTEHVKIDVKFPIFKKE